MKKKISLVCVSTVHHEQIEKNLKKTVENVPHIKDIIVFSNKKINFCSTYVKIKDDFGLMDYDWFVLKNLSFFINTDYVLIVQPDSMAVNKDAWTEDFFNFDYIGAETEKCGIYNGGFSLRSKKLLEVLLQPEIKRVNLLRNKQFYGFNEDVLITKIYKDWLTKHGINVCNTQISNQFSTDTTINNVKSLGFHGAFNALKFLKFNEAVEFIEQLHRDSKHWGMYQKLILDFQKHGFDYAASHFLTSKKYSHKYFLLQHDYCN